MWQKKALITIFLILVLFGAWEAVIIWQANTQFETIFSSHGFSSNDFSNGTFKDPIEWSSDAIRNRFAELFFVQKDLIQFYDAFPTEPFGLLRPLKAKTELLILQIDFLNQKSVFWVSAPRLAEQLNQGPCLYSFNADQLVDGQRRLWVSSIELQSQLSELQQTNSSLRMDINPDLEFKTLQFLELAQERQQSECNQFSGELQ